MCEYTCDIFLPSGDPLLCQLFPMMLNSHWNIVSGENCFIRKTTLAHSFNSVTLPLSPLISYSYRLYRSPVSPSVPASVPSWITFALFCLWFILFFSSLVLYILPVTQSALKTYAFLSHMILSFVSWMRADWAIFLVLFSCKDAIHTMMHMLPFILKAY